MRRLAEVIVAVLCVVGVWWVFLGAIEKGLLYMPVPTGIRG